MWTLEFWKATAERAVSTAAQAALLAWGSGALPDVSLPWWTILTFAGGGFALSVLKALGASQLGNGGPSLTSAEKLES